MSNADRRNQRDSRAPAPPNAAPAPSADPPTLQVVRNALKSPGQIAAEAIALEAKARLLGKEPEEAAPIEESLEETWHLDALANVREAPAAELAGLYRVTHGTLFLSATKTACKGRNIRLTALDARHFLEQGLVERLAD